VTRTIDGLPYLLSLTDTAGQEEYRGLWETANMKSDAFLLVYDITNEASLCALSFFLDLIAIEAEQREEDNNRLMKELGDEVEVEGLEVGLPPPVTIVAGNKCDLKDARVVAARDGLETARKHGCGFMETSARDMVNVEETFACRSFFFAFFFLFSDDQELRLQYSCAGWSKPGNNTTNKRARPKRPRTQPQNQQQPGTQPSGRNQAQPRRRRGGSGFWVSAEMTERMRTKTNRIRRHEDGGVCGAGDDS
jgi:hypothetical protein